MPSAELRKKTLKVSCKCCVCGSTAAALSLRRSETFDPSAVIGIDIRNMDDCACSCCIYWKEMVLRQPSGSMEIVDALCRRHGHAFDQEPAKQTAGNTCLRCGVQRSNI